LNDWVHGTTSFFGVVVAVVVLVVVEFSFEVGFIAWPVMSFIK